jgi:carbonic anhydrase/acetyltransferase-like protein (isoleucine patch superfamily)
MNGRVGSMNLQFDPALLRRDMSHIDVIDTSIVREDYTMHGLHLNSPGKKRPTQLIAERVVSGHASGISSNALITHARASFLA